MSQDQAQRPSLLHDLLMLAVQIACIALGVVVIFSFVFGVMRVTDPSMEPRFQDGDLVLFYRIGKQYDAHDVVVFKRDGLLTSGRATTPSYGLPSLQGASSSWRLSGAVVASYADVACVIQGGMPQLIVTTGGQSPSG